MGNDKIITFVNDDNLIDSFDGELLCAFELDKNKYIVYSRNEKDYDGNSIIYFGKINELNGKQIVSNLDFDEFSLVKDIVKKMIGYNGDNDDV